MVSVLRSALMPGLVGLPLAAVLAPLTADAGDLADRGREIATVHCARCHVVDPARPFSGISSTPSFHLLVTAFDDWRERFETFYARRPHPAVVRFAETTPLSDDPPAVKTVELTLDDVDAIVAFAERLQVDAATTE